jgi:NTE family protein
MVNSIINNIFPKGQNKNYNTGLVLSGGAARGFGHLGVLKALNEKGINPDIISGVSAGAIVGSFYCDGYKPEEILEIFMKRKIFKLVKLRVSKKGLFKISGLEKILKKYLKTNNIEDLKIPLVITATDIVKGTTKFFKNGTLVDSVLASSSIPVVFRSKEIDGNFFVDGGVTNNLPAEPLTDICNELIGVNVNPIGAYDPKKGLAHMALHSFHLSIASGIEEKKKLFKYFIEPLELKNYTYYDIANGKEMFEIGYKEALKVINNN